MSTPQHISFGVTDIENQLDALSAEKLNDLAFGAVQLDGSGKILAYNDAEGEITGRNPKDMLGKNFFTEVAPCTNVKGFHDKFAEGVKNGNLNTTIAWTFNYNMTPLKVQIHMKKAATHGKYWIFVKRL